MIVRGHAVDEPRALCLCRIKTVAIATREIDRLDYASRGTPAVKWRSLLSSSISGRAHTLSHRGT